jgi:gamma-glutamyl:cysteine ligase YbdK (ATP-grasp superfamily)
MGQEISSTRFKKTDFSYFEEKLAAETELLQSWFTEQRFSRQQGVGGLEVEAWLIDRQARPAPVNEQYLRQLDNPLVVPELARFNVELNVHPQQLTGDGLTKLFTELDDVWQSCQCQANRLDNSLVMTGILPTVSDRDLTLANMSAMKRYAALNQQVLRARLGQPLNLDIVGREHLQTQHHDVMLESAATSFQLHLQCNLDNARRLFNASIIASAPTVAISANAPYLFGKDLWDESRIPLFEQAVEVGGYRGAAQGPVRRVTFGSGYIRESVMECFRENFDHYPILLPVKSEDDTSMLPHLRLHNGTIWRWNRPLIGFDDDGTPHIRVEHRVMPAGPTVIDQIANAAFYFGLAYWMNAQDIPPETRLSFAGAKNNFYQAARRGLAAHIDWLDGNRYTIRDLVLRQLLRAAADGLESLNIDAADISRYLGIVEARVSGKQNGAAWQRAFVTKYGLQLDQLTKEYVARQDSGEPVHLWTV